MYGNLFKSGIFAESSSPADIAPTIANILGISPPPLAEGHVLAEALNWTSRTKYVKPNR